MLVQCLINSPFCPFKGLPLKGLPRLDMLNVISIIYDYNQIFFKKLSLGSTQAIENVFYVCVDWYKRECGWENSRQLCNPETKSRVCIKTNESSHTTFRYFVKLAYYFPGVLPWEETSGVQIFFLPPQQVHWEPRFQLVENFENRHV